MKKISFLIIILIAFFLRSYSLDRSPSSINWDEAALGYNAYSLSQTGRDEYGKFLPVSIKSFGDYKASLYSYLSVPIIKFFGLNQTTTRMVSALAGTVSLVGLWLFLGVFIQSYWLKFIIWTILSFEPWRLHYSRIALESNLSASIFIFAAYYLYQSKKRFPFTGILLFVLSAYAYHSAKMSAPALIFFFLVDPLMWFISFNKFKISKLYGSLVSILLFTLLMLPLFISSGSQALTRLNQENIFTKLYPFAPSEIFTNNFLSWIRLNPLYYLFGVVTGHIVAYFSPANFSTNIYHWIDHSVMMIPEFGFLGLIEIFFLIVGIVVLFKNIQNEKYRFVFYWLIAGSIPSVLTWNWIHSLRFMNALPAVEIIAAFGFVKVISYFKSKIFIILLLMVFLWQTAFIINNEFVFSVWQTHGEFQPGGFKQGVPIISQLQSKYDKIIIDSPHAQSYIFFLFYQSYDPREIQKYGSSRNYANQDGSWNFNFGKYEFRKINWYQEFPNLHHTIIWMPATINQDQIDRLSNAKAYYLPNPIKPYNSSMIVTLE